VLVRDDHGKDHLLQDFPHGLWLIVAPVRHALLHRPTLARKCGVRAGGCIGGRARRFILKWSCARASPPQPRSR
jgi:hypothetical protein